MKGWSSRSPTSAQTPGNRRTANALALITGRQAVHTGHMHAVLFEEIDGAVVMSCSFDSIDHEY